MKDISTLILKNIFEDVVATSPATTAAPYEDRFYEKLYSKAPKVFNPFITAGSKAYQLAGRNPLYPLASKNVQHGPRFETKGKIDRNMFGNARVTNPNGDVVQNLINPLFPEKVSEPIQRGASREQLHRVYPSIPLNK